MTPRPEFRLCAGVTVADSFQAAVDLGLLSMKRAARLWPARRPTSRSASRFDDRLHWASYNEGVRECLRLLRFYPRRVVRRIIARAANWDAKLLERTQIDNSEVNGMAPTRALHGAFRRFEVSP